MAGLVAHVFVSTVGAVFNSVAAFVVRDDFFVGADEVGLGAGTSGVVAGGGGGRNDGSIDSVEGETAERHDRDDEGEENDVR